MPVYIIHILQSSAAMHLRCGGIFNDSLVWNFLSFMCGCCLDMFQLSKFTSLSEDGVWGVRRACAESVVRVSSACSMLTRQSQLVPLFLALINDQSRWVCLLLCHIIHIWLLLVDVFA